MSTDRAAVNRESVPTCWTALDEVFFTLVGDVLGTSFLWGAAVLLASYDPDDVPALTPGSRRRPPGASLPTKRSLAA